MIMLMPVPCALGMLAAEGSAPGGGLLSSWMGNPTGRLLLLLCLLSLLLLSLLMVLVPLMRRSAALVLRRLTAQLDAIRLGASARLAAASEEGEARALAESLNLLLAELQERARREATERKDLQAILDTTLGTGMLATDLEGRIAVFSRGACNLLGYEAGELLGRSAEVLFPEEAWRDILPRLARRSLRESGMTLRSEMLRRDRSRFPIFLSLARSESEPGRFVALFRGAHEERELERRAVEAERKLELVFESVPDALLVVQKGRIVSANAKSAALLGVARSDLIGRPFLEAVAAEDLLLGLERMERTLLAGVPEAFQARLLPATPTSRYRKVQVGLARLDGSAGPALLVTLADDPRRVEDETSEAGRKLLDATLDSISEGILAQDISGPVPVSILVNSSLEKLLGAGGEQILHWPEARLLEELAARGAAPDDIARLRAALQAESGGSALLELTAPARRSLEIVCGPLRLPGEESKGRIITFRDTTERREAERALRQGHEALAASEQRLRKAVEALEAARADLAKRNEQLEKLNRELHSVDEMKSNLLANVSHELQTPLVLIKGYTEMILKRKIGPLTPEQEKGLSVALKNIDRLVEMIDNLLDFSRMERGESPLDLEEFPLWQVVDEVVELVREKIRGKNLSLTTEYETDNLVIRADRGKISQVFINLLSNAIKFNRAGGEISIRVTAGEEGTLAVEIRDTGIGIPPEEQEKIFERFYQVDSSPRRRAEGTGIGLSIVKDILALHGCSIRVESRAGEGSRFTFTLPLGRVAAAPHSGAMQQPSGQPGGRGEHG